MRFSAPTDTLAYHLQARPLVLPMSFQDMPAKTMGEAAKAFLATAGSDKAQPEREALWFYLGNHVLAEIRKRRHLHEPLSQQELEAVRRVFAVSNRVFLRLLYYVTVICVRESRHLLHPEELAEKAEKLGLGKAFKFVNKVPDSAEKAMQVFLDKMPAGLTIGELADCLSFVFHSNGHWSHGYGGPKWGNVSDCLKNLVHGQYSPEMFCDVGFTLAHNGGPIFNKGIIRATIQGRRSGGSS